MRALRTKPAPKPTRTPRPAPPELTRNGIAAPHPDEEDPNRSFDSVMREGATTKRAGGLPENYVLRCIAKDGSHGVDVLYPKDRGGKLWWDVDAEGYAVRIQRRFDKPTDAVLAFPTFLARYNQYTFSFMAKVIPAPGHNSSYSPLLLLSDVQNRFEVVQGWSFKMAGGSAWREFKFPVYLRRDTVGHWLSLTIALGGEEGDYLFDELAVIRGTPLSPPPPPPLLLASTEMMHMRFDDYTPGDVTRRSLGAGSMRMIPQHPAAGHDDEYGLWVETTQPFRSECSAQLVLRPFLVPGGILGYSFRFWARTKSAIRGVPPKLMIQDLSDDNATLRFGYIQLEPPAWRRFEFQMEVSHPSPAPAPALALALALAPAPSPTRARTVSYP
jgi:hypothetical protein